MSMTEPHPEEKPIFITGSVRTGTSVVTRALTVGAKIPGYTEGCFIDLIGAFGWQTDQAYNNRVWQRKNKEIMLAHVDREQFTEDLLQWFKSQYQKYNIFNGEERWIDKTASRHVLRSLPYIQRVWPEAKFILMKRRPIDNIASRLRKFSRPSFEQHCIMLKDIFDAQEEAKKKVDPESFLEIDQYDIATQPHIVAQDIGLFLDLSMEQIHAMQKILTNDRPEFTGGDEQNISSLDDMPWSDEDKETFVRVLGKMMQKGGWSIDRQYYS